MEMKMVFGIGAMLGRLGGNDETVAAHQAAIGKTIASMAIDADDRLRISFTDGTTLVASDEGQSCCEHRYMVGDDDLSHFVGATFSGAELRDAPNEPDDYGEHEVQFLLINTSVGAASFATHNEHNGYYGGFWVVLRTEEPAPAETA